jgi:acetyltransferase-like isoleucine patch superfamily enzyme
MDVKFLLFKKLFGKVYTFHKRVLDRIQYWTVLTNPNIHLSASTSVDASAKVQIKYGGSIHIGDNTEVLEGVIIQTYGGKITIGSGCSINPYTVIYGHGNTIIGNNVLIAGGCMIISSNHSYTDLNKTIKDQESVSKGIAIESNVWIGHGCSILDGVVIGEGSVIAAGSVVNASIPPFSVAAGVPAKVIKRRE